MTISRRALAAAGSLALVATVATAVEWRLARPGYAWSFPRDHWAHEGYRTEWWYFTGDLASVDEPSRRFGYQFTLFRIALLPARPNLASDWAASAFVMGHAAVTDLVAGEHRFSETLVREVPFLASFASFPERPIGRVRAPAGTDAWWSLDWSGDGFAFEVRDDARRLAFALATRPRKPLVFQGPGGLSVKGPEGAASLYTSFTRLETEGVIEIDGRRFRVRGESWMDKEFGSSQLSERQVGWDWFSLRLDDGRDLMLYLLRRADGTTDWTSATRVDPSGAAAWLPSDAWSVAPTAFWTSRKSGARYPVAWRIDLPGEGLALEVTARLENQENVARLARGVVYWEGAVRVIDRGSGAEVGSGYVELTGYAEGSRPPI